MIQRWKRPLEVSAGYYGLFSSLLRDLPHVIVGMLMVILWTSI